MKTLKLGENSNYSKGESQRSLFVPVKIGWLSMIFKKVSFTQHISQHSKPREDNWLVFYLINCFLFRIRYVFPSSLEIIQNARLDVSPCSAATSQPTPTQHITGHCGGLRVARRARRALWKAWSGQEELAGGLGWIKRSGGALIGGSVDEKSPSICCCVPAFHYHNKHLK
jgi:hypothetical protein